MAPEDKTAICKGRVRLGLKHPQEGLQAAISGRQEEEEGTFGIKST